MYMKKLTLLLAIICSISLFAEPQYGVVYVKAGATGTGASWSDAMGDIQLAINEAKSPTKPRKDVWIAKGEFVITKCIDMKDSVNVYGSFAGTETTLAQRAKVTNGNAWDFVNPTTLKGSNARIVQTAVNLKMETVFDGFIVTDGNGDGSATQFAGGGIFLRPGMVAQNCIVKNNSSKNAGGGVSMYPGGTVRYCLIKDNTHITGASGGGGININTTVGLIGIVDNCEITGNSSTVRGGAINTQGTGMTYITNCKIYNNKAVDGTTLKGGGALYIAAAQASNNLIYNNNGASVVYINGSSMYNNTIVKNVGSVYMAAGTTNLSNNIVWACATDDTGATPTSVGGAVATTFTVKNNATYNPVTTENGWIIADNIQFSSNANNGDVTPSNPGTTGTGPKFVGDNHRFIGVALSELERDSLKNANFELAPLSPCVNSGIMVAEVVKDITGLARPQGFPVATAKYDIGAYELPYYTIVAGEAVDAGGKIYDKLGVLLTKDFTKGYAKGDKYELFFEAKTANPIYRAYYTISDDNGITFKGSQVNFTSEIDKDGMWSTTVKNSFKVSVEWVKPTAVKGLNDSGIVCFGTNNGVQIQGLTANKEVKIYNMSGMQMSKINAEGTDLFVPLNRGVYFVVMSEGSQKVIVK